jgi:hypothetical protein
MDTSMRRSIDRKFLEIKFISGAYSNWETKYEISTAAFVYILNALHA